jgi:hypothetical protein
MDVNGAAAALNGSEYREEGSRELFAAMKAANLVAVFGASDDLMEFRGAIDDEIGAWDGGIAYVTADGMLANDCENESCPHFERAKQSAASIRAIWAPDDLPHSWLIKSDIPHETFEVVEDGQPYCRGIVFSLSALHSQGEAK